MKRILFTVYLLSIIAFSNLANAQILIGDPDKEPESFSMVQLEGKGGLRLPVLTTSQRDALSLSGNNKALGLVIYHITLQQVEYWNGTQWVTPLLESENGLTVHPDGRKIELGGNLVENTTIDLKDKNLYFNFTTGKFRIGDKLLTVAGDRVGINTDDSQGIFHLEADNSIIINTAGKMGVGMLPQNTDTSRLQVNGSVTIKNSGETPVPGAEYVLATADQSGQAKWIKNHTLRDKIVGQLGGIPAPGGEVLNGFSGFVGDANITSSASGGTWTGAHITLPPGLWIIQSSINVQVSREVSGGNTIWFRLQWHLTPTGGGNWAPVVSGPLSSGTIYSYTDNGMVNGSTILQNSGTTPRTYYLYIYYCEYYGNQSNYAGMNYVKVGSKDYPQNSIVAYPALGD